MLEEEVALKIKGGRQGTSNVTLQCGNKLFGVL